ncbi:MAG: heparinase II/III family protein [Candidatus Latescibacteria bacterium]|jgi:hypothetical protein|nr:heparinase II/III family protein [Candidatus Latescibacterota bacterium]
MPADRAQFRKAVQSYFAKMDRWTPGPEGFANLCRDALGVDEVARKAKRYPRVIQRAADQARCKLDGSTGPDRLRRQATSRMSDAAFYYLFTGDRKALGWAREALDVLDSFERPHFCHITLIGSTDVDLQTAGVTRALSAMKACFADILDAETARRLNRMAIKRCLMPGLEAQRTRRYFWTHCTHNWRSVVAGSFAMGAMAFADVFSDWRELIEYGIEGVLVVLEDGDRAGGWQEGPGYWEYGIGHCAEFAWALKLFTGGKVDLFRHRYLKNTGDFRIYMTTAPGRVWNWSDGGKTAGSSLTLCILAREFGNVAYQAAALRGGVASISHLFHLDLDLKGDPPNQKNGFPLTKVFPDINVSVMRTGFGRDDTFVGVKGGTIGAGVNHEHEDLGSVTIHAGGRELLAEIERWPYAQHKGVAGGFFDRRGRRWDYDGNAVDGHNLVVLEGRYPPFTSETTARVQHADLARGCELVSVDATAMHKALARRVRRYVIYLRPDLALFVDEIHARESIRARCLFHYLDRVEIEDDRFTIASGGARLDGVSLHPATEHNVIIGNDRRKIAYHTENGLQHLANDYIYTSNLHRSKDIVFVTGLHFGRKPLPDVKWTLEGHPVEDTRFSVNVRRGRKTARFRIELGAAKLERRIRLAK